MQIKVQIIMSHNTQEIVQEIGCFERQDLSQATLGLTLEEAKILTSEAQKKIIEQQVMIYIQQEKYCKTCGRSRHLKGYHKLTYRTLFGQLHLKSPRFWNCEGCISGNGKNSSFSPLAKLLTERISPELSYLESKWVSLMSYGMTVQLLEEVFPLTKAVSSVFYHTHHIASRLEQELGEEKIMFVEGCQRDWAQLSRPSGPLSVGLDGGYVHAREGKNRKAGWFEIIVGKSLQEQKESRRFGFVTAIDKKPKRRLYEMLKDQGLQMNQEITFLTDGGDTVRSLPLYLSPQSEHIIDWFHITMRLTVFKQIAKGIKTDDLPKLDRDLDRIKWYLWHGNVFQALQKLDFLCMDLEDESPEIQRTKLLRSVEEFYGYIQKNQKAIPNYGQKYRFGEIISTAFVESTVNEVISKRMVKKQQMRWTKKGAHLLLQLRIKTLNHELKKTYENWYPQMKKEAPSHPSIH